MLQDLDKADVQQSMADYSMQPITPIIQSFPHPPKGYDKSNTHAAITRRLQGAMLSQRDANYKGEHELNINLLDVTLFKLDKEVKGPSQTINNSTSVSSEVGGSIEVKCKQCYLSALASAEINIKSDSDDFRSTLNATIERVETQVNETVTETYDSLQAYFGNSSNWDDYAKSVFENIVEDGEFELTDLLPANINISSFDDDLKAAIPDTTITFRFDDLDLYLELETILQVSSTYTVKLIPPGYNPLGLDLPHDISLGVIFTADLIFAIDGELDITGGLHIKIDDHVSMQLELFGDNVSEMSLKGGHFELLPVTVRSATAAFTATLRLGAKAALTLGNQIHLPNDIPDSIGSAHIGNVSLSDLQLGGGILMGVNADVAVFKTSFEVVPADPECDFRIIQDYSLVLGATAGAQVTVGTATYGPAVALTTPVYTTTLKSYCVVAAATTSTAELIAAKRQASTGAYETVLSTTRIQAAVECPMTVTGECPVSLQTTLKQIDPLTTTIYADAQSDLPSRYPTESIVPLPITRVPLGTGAYDLNTITGSPTTYTAMPTNIIFPIEPVWVDTHIRTIIIAVSIGVGLPVLIIIGILIYYCCYAQRKKKSRHI